MTNNELLMSTLKKVGMYDKLLRENIFLRVVILVLGIVFAIFFAYTNNPRLEPLDNGNIQKAVTIDSLTAKIEDLKHELFISQTIIDRYEIAIAIYKEQNPKAMEKLEYILYTQTE